MTRDEILLAMLVDHDAGRMTQSSDIPTPLRRDMWMCGLTAWGWGYTLTPDGLAEARLVRRATALDELTALAGRLG